MELIVTLHALRRYMGLDAADTADDDRLLTVLMSAARTIERAAGRRFTPHAAAIRHTWMDAQWLVLRDDLLELTGLTNGDGTEIDLADVLLIPPGDPAAGLLCLTNGRSFSWQTTPVAALTVTGVWGWHDRWSEAWQLSGDSVQNAALSAEGTVLTVTDADGLDTDGFAPRFQVGHVLRIEDEYLRVIAVNSVTNMLTVTRGANGTTAAAHAQGMPIEVYAPPAEVETLVLRWADWLYRERDTPLSDAPPALAEALSSLQRL